MSNPVDYPEMNDLDEQLTAYLDGELSSDESKDLEQRLIDDETLRMRLAELRKSYELLDELPETPYDQRFTQSTIEHVIRDVCGVPPAEVLPVPTVRPVGRFSKNARFLIGLAGIAVAAMMAAFFIRNTESNRQLQELGIVSNLSGWMDVNELDIATKLSEETFVVECLKEHLADKFVETPPVILNDRVDWVASMSIDQQAKLESDFDSLRRMNVESRTRFEAIQKKVEERPNSKQVQDTVRVIGLLMDSLPNSERRDLNGLKGQTRLQYIKSQMYFYAAKHYFIHKLSSQDSDAIKDWCENYLEPELLKKVPDFMRRSLSDGQRGLDSLVNLFAYRFVESADRPQILELLSSLSPNLSENGQSLFKNLSPTQQMEVMFHTLAPNRWGSDQSIVETYEKISPKWRESLDLTDPSSAKRRILEESRRRRIRP